METSPSGLRGCDMGKLSPPTVPFVEARHVGKKQRPTSILIRSSSTTSVKGAAFGIAMAWHKNSRRLDSCHYVVDEATTYQCVPDRMVAYSMAIPPKGLLSINLCWDPVSNETYWDDEARRKVLDNGVALVAQLVLAYKIPVRYLDLEMEKKWYDRPSRRRGGIIDRMEGAWPKDEFLKLVENQVGFVRKYL